MLENLRLDARHHLNVNVFFLKKSYTLFLALSSLFYNLHFDLYVQKSAVLLFLDYFANPPHLLNPMYSFSLLLTQLRTLTIIPLFSYPK